MRPTLLVVGLLGVAVGGATLYAARHHLDRLGVERQQRDALRKGIAVLAGMLITFGLAMAAVGMFG
ncbi:hypothetical protein [Halovivax sp.]|uniref:hypothetical protein n=1 Tax=Halovivax sp. TaxID=1935978 RepID=UPI0025C56A2B|nr:hypothetical protein [Halovivax sp.]